MTMANSKKVLILLAIFFGLELLSFAAFTWPVINTALFIILVLGALAVTIANLEYGLLIVLAELFIGSMGHLFYINIGETQLSIRICLWAIVMAVYGVNFIIQLIKKGKPSPYWQSIKNFRGWKIYLLLGTFIVIAVLNGWLRGHAFSLIFSDFNAWLYFALLGPILAIYNTGKKENVERLKMVFISSAIWLSLKTLFLLFVFTHNYGGSTEVYLWLRKTLVGEMTPTKTGWPRIFIQGQVYAAISFFLVFWYSQAFFKIKEIFKKPNISALLLAALFFTSVLISFSRSFWVGFAGATFFTLILIWRLDSFKKALSSVLWLFVSGILSFAILYLVGAFPYIHLGAGNMSPDFLDRVSNGNESAIASRWSLLPVLFGKIGQEPFLGQGYGATVTYLSSDPRILQNNPSGEYTTYAFEWGYLDLWLKLGLLGLAVYLWLYLKLIITAWRDSQKTKDYLVPALATGLIFIALTNIFTPYLNHPLGIGYLLLSSCLIWPNRVY